MGADVWNVPFDNVTQILQVISISRVGFSQSLIKAHLRAFQIFFINMLLYTVSRGLIRASIIFLYMRILETNSDSRLSRAIVATQVFNILFELAFVLAVVLQCNPVDTFWLQWDGEHEGYCGNSNAIAWAAAGVAIFFFDAWLFILPFPRIWGLNLHWKKKLMAGVMFAVGLWLVRTSWTHIYHASADSATIAVSHNRLRLYVGDMSWAANCHTIVSSLSV